MCNKIYKLSTSEFEALIKNSHNINEVLFKLGLTSIGNSWGYSLVRKRMSELNLSGENFIGKTNLIRNNKTQIIKNSELFINNSTVPRCVVRRRIIEQNLLEYKCSCCGISEWNGKSISLELDHINGVNNDNRLENLRFLCPNCHSQTVTYGGKNINKLFKASNSVEQELKDAIINTYKTTASAKKTSKILDVKLSVVINVLKEANIYLKVNQKYVIRYDLLGVEICRYGSINEACQALIDSKELKTNKIKTARNTFLRNYEKQWLGSTWKVISKLDNE